MNFRSDNTAGASEKVLAALIAANQGAQPAYGYDDMTARAEKALCEVFERDVAMFLVTTGTAANSLALSCVTPPWGAVICHAESHVMRDECGAPEFFTHGAKLVGLPGTGCKLSADAVRETLAALPSGAVHSVQPAALTLSQATECGMAYAPSEIAALAEVAHGRGLAVHMDGARFANALATLGCTPAEMSWKAGIDVLSFGATKNGCLAAEAVIFFDKAKAAEMKFRRKRSGHTLSKGRLLAAQMLAYLADGHWLDLARKANAAAAQLEEALASLPGVRMGWPRQANEAFAIIPDGVARQLREAGAAFHPWSADYLSRQSMPGPGETLYRFVCSFRTSPLEIEGLRRAGRGEEAATRRIKVKQ